MNYYSTGDVAKKLNMSLRTLRYYDEIGLVVPSEKNESGKRYYSDEDMLALEKIALLKATSMSLKDIKQVMQQVTIKKVLSFHKEELETNIRQLQQSLLHTNTLLNVLKLEGTLKWDQLLPLISKSDLESKQKRKKQVWKHLFNEEEQSFLLQQLPKMEDDQGQTVKWINIAKRIEICIDKGETPNSEAGQLIAEDIILLTKETFGENQALANQFWKVRKSEQASYEFNLYPVKKEIIDFIEKAVSHYEENQ